MWIYQTLAHAYIAVGDNEKYIEFLIKAQRSSSGSFDAETFDQHNEEVGRLLESIRTKLETMANEENDILFFGKTC